MSIIHGLDSLGPEVLHNVLTIGNFDGVHRGHQAIISRAVTLAREHACRVLVLTFDPHPLRIVAPERAPDPLMPVADKGRRLLEAGADTVVVAHSTRILLSMPAERFVDKVIAERFGPRCIVEGPSFGFGRDRKGNVALLRELGRQHGFGTVVVDPLQVQLGGEEPVVISSSLVRELLRQGQVEPARICLGRPYALSGVVGRGYARGAQLGFPTANLTQVEQLLPADGVYAGAAMDGDTTIPAAISIGSTPTFDGQRLQVEAHLLDQDRPLYDRSLSLQFYRRLRAQQRFQTVEALRQQIAQDIEQVRIVWQTETDDEISPTIP